MELLRTLESGLPGSCNLFHGVDWSKGTAELEQHGEIDIVVVNQGGDVLLMEVKSGSVDFRPDGIFKRYGAQTKDVKSQVQRQFGALLARLRDAGLIGVKLHHLLVLPDVRVESETVQWPRERIVDSADIDQVVLRVMQVLGPGAADGRTLERLHSYRAFWFGWYAAFPHTRLVK